MKKIVFAAVMAALLSMSAIAFAAVPGPDDCLAECNKDRSSCVKDGDQDCQLLETQCRERCDNIGKFADCVSLCGEGEPQCLDSCRNDFRSRVPMYRLWLERHGR